MVWIKATYEFASLFSYRIPDFSSQYALSSILPGPSTVKLAIVSTAIETTGDIGYGREIFEIVKSAEIKIELPKKVAQTNLLIKRLKKRKEPDKKMASGKGACYICGKKTDLFLDKNDNKNKCKDCWGLETTFGIRGYVHYPGIFSVYLNTSKNNGKKIKKILTNVRRFGTSDSLVWCRNVSEETPSSRAISAVEKLGKENNRNVLILPVKDINPEISFDDVNIYNRKKSKKDIFSRKIYSIPLTSRHQGKNWMVYEFS
jgi:CRISPR-associated Cas5-like protein